MEAAWTNHFEAFGAQNVEQILLDYTETSEVHVFNQGTGAKDAYVGLEAIGKCFKGLFNQLSDLSGLAAPVVDVNEKQKQVFLVWSCPSSGVKSASDTFLFDDAGKIVRQNVNLTLSEPVPTVEYKPQTVQDAWDNHFDGFNRADISAILRDYNEESQLSVFNHSTQILEVYTGTNEIARCFRGLFQVLQDRSDMEAPVIDVDEAKKTVFLAWKCPASGVVSASDTFLFGDDLKIVRQNVDLTTK